MQRVQHNDFPSPQDHIHAYSLYKDQKISYQEYKDVNDFYVYVYHESRLSKVNQIKKMLEHRLKRRPSQWEIERYYIRYFN